MYGHSYGLSHIVLLIGGTAPKDRGSKWKQQKKLFWLFALVATKLHMFQRLIIMLKILALHLAMVGIAWNLNLNHYFAIVVPTNDQIQKND